MRRFVLRLLRSMGVVTDSLVPAGDRVEALSATSIPGGLRLQVALWCAVPRDVVLSAMVDGTVGTLYAPVYARHDGEGRQVEDLVYRGRGYQPGEEVVVSAFVGLGRNAAPLAFSTTTVRVQ
ncbi:hypothetical protein [Nonomuraea salmonea]|uniref:Uncharacterized protein n=1 Tax=Nonomuraea salmonea TaxID=46181 RepID=A0ABV5P2P3_9ACTN